MNHTCDGDVFTRWGKKLGRCLYDSTIFEIREGMEFCPNCERPWAGGEHESFDPDDWRQILIQVDLPHFRFLADERAKKIKYLEEQLETWKKMYKDKAGITAF